MTKQEILTKARTELEKIWCNNFDEIVDYDFDDQLLERDFIIDIDEDDETVEVYTAALQWGTTTASQNNGFCFMQNDEGVTFSDVMCMIEDYIENRLEQK